MRTPRVLALGMTLLVLLGACSSAAVRTTAPSRRRAPPRARRRAPRRPSAPASAEAAKADDQDRLGQLLRVEAHGRDLRPGPRERRLQGRAQVRPRLAPGARSRRWSGPGRPGPRVRRLGPRLLRQDQDHRRRRGQRDRAPGGRSRRKGITVLGIRPGQDTNAFVVRVGHGDQPEPDEDERPGRRPGPAQVGPAVRLRHEPALRGRAQDATGSPTRRSSARRSARATCRWPRPSRARRSTSPSSARPSRPSPSSGSSSSTTTRRPSRPRTSPRSSATTTWPRSTRPRSRRCSTRHRPR